MFDNKGMILSEALFLLMLISITGVLCFQIAISINKMEQLENFHDERIKESYEQ